MSARVPTSPASGMILRVVPKHGQSWYPKEDEWKGKSLGCGHWYHIQGEGYYFSLSPC